MTYSKTYTQGTILQFTYKCDGHIQVDNQFILAESFDKGYSFQIICVKGYHTGCIEGYIKDEGTRGPISFNHLKNELSRNFQNLMWDSFKIIEHRTI